MERTVGANHDDIRHPELIPNLASFGNIEDLLADGLPSYSPLHERKTPRYALDFLGEHVVSVGIADLLPVCIAGLDEAYLHVVPFPHQFKRLQIGVMRDIRPVHRTEEAALVFEREILAKRILSVKSPNFPRIFAA